MKRRWVICAACVAFIAGGFSAAAIQTEQVTINGPNGPAGCLDFEKDDPTGPWRPYRAVTITTPQGCTATLTPADAILPGARVCNVDLAYVLRRVCGSSR